MSTSKGLFISFEGIDGCGKSTQIKMLCSYLKDRNKEFLMVREPGGTDISEQIRKILLHRHDQEISDRTEALLMTGSRAQLIDEKILPFLIHLTHLSIQILDQNFYFVYKLLNLHQKALLDRLNHIELILII